MRVSNARFFILVSNYMTTPLSRILTNTYVYSCSLNILVQQYIAVMSKVITVRFIGTSASLMMIERILSSTYSQVMIQPALLVFLVIFGFCKTLPITMSIAFPPLEMQINHVKLNICDPPT